MFKILAFPTPFVAQSEGSVVWPLGKRTYIMATLNCTPDSFSDGGDHHTLSTALEFARSAVANGADMIDIGGYSTRPGAEDISPEEEMNRVIPAIKAIRNAGISLPISIDTFRAAVAEKAIQAGANCINDVKALDGEDDERMRELASRLGVPVIFVHSRGDAGSNKSYPQPGVAAGVRTELGEKIAKALKAGVKRWNVVGDPGIGFSKTPEDNATLLRDLARFTAPEVVASSRRSTVRDLRLIQPVHPLTSLPVLVGTSRKSFLSTLVGRPTSPKERGYATAATCVVAVQQGCDIVRVHDVLEMRDAVRVADTVWRSR